MHCLWSLGTLEYFCRDCGVELASFFSSVIYARRKMQLIMHAPSWTSSTRHRSRSSDLYLFISLQASTSPSVMSMRAWLLPTFLPAAAWALSCTCIRRAATFCSLSLCSIDLTKGVSNCSSRSHHQGWGHWVQNAQAMAFAL